MLVAFLHVYSLCHASASMHLILGTLGTARGRGAHDVETDDGVTVGCPEDGRTPECKC